MAYFITKLQGDQRTHRIVAVRAKRDVARTDCKSFGKSAAVRSEADIAGFHAAGVLDTDPKHLHGFVLPEADAPKGSKTHSVEPGTVAAATGEPAKAPSLLDAAKGILAKPAGKQTMGGKAKAEPKRPATDAAILAAARVALAAMCAVEGATKVGIVRSISTWQVNALQRRDVFAIMRDAEGYAAPAVCKDIADATISTQFQVARARARDAAAEAAAK